MPRMALGALLPVLSVALVAASGADLTPDTLPEELGRAAEVRDPLFSILIWLIDTDQYGYLSAEQVAAELSGETRSTRIPYRHLSSIERRPVVRGRSSQVSLQFRDDLDVPLPYRILGYAPGRVRATRACSFREWNLGRMKVPSRHGDVILEDVHLFGLLEGDVTIDVDSWLDWLLGDGLDDTDVTFLMLCRHDQRWLGFGMGYSAHDSTEGRSGVMDFAKDHIKFPTPRRLRSVGPGMRLYGEHLFAVNDGAS